MINTLRIAVTVCFLASVFGGTVFADPTNLHIAGHQAWDAPAKKNMSIAIILSGDEPLFTRLVEEGLAVSFARQNFKIVERDKIEAAVEQATQAAKSENPVGAEEMARTAGADYLVTGALLVSHSNDRGLVVEYAAVQIIALGERASRLRFLVYWKEGTAIPEFGSTIVRVINRQLPKRK